MSKKYAYVIGIMALITLVISYLVNLQNGARTIINGLIGLILSIFVTFMLRVKRDLKLLTFYGLSVISMLLLSSPSGREINGVIRWLAFGDTLFRPSHFLLVSTLLLIAITQGGINKQTDSKEVFARNAFLLITTLLFWMYNSYWLPQILVLTISLYFALKTKNTANITTNILFMLIYVVRFIYKVRWTIQNWPMLFNYRLKQLKKASLLGPAVTDYDPSWIENDSFLSILLNWGWIGLILIFLFFLLFSYLIFLTKNTAKRSNDLYGYQISSAVGSYFLLTTVFSFIDAITSPVSSSFLLIDSAGLESILFFFPIALILQILISHERTNDVKENECSNN